MEESGLTLLKINVIEKFILYLNHLKLVKLVSLGSLFYTWTFRTMSPTFSTKDWTNIIKGLIYFTVMNNSVQLLYFIHTRHKYMVHSWRYLFSFQNFNGRIIYVTNICISVKCPCLYGDYKLVDRQTCLLQELCLRGHFMIFRETFTITLLTQIYVWTLVRIYKPE